jgi:hypothetical protein
MSCGCSLFLVDGLFARHQLKLVEQKAEDFLAERHVLELNLHGTPPQSRETPTTVPSVPAGTGVTG